jgi:hypothetical protein
MRLEPPPQGGRLADEKGHVAFFISHGEMKTFFERAVKP